MGTRNVVHNPHLEVIGHRGHLSHFPENTIAGFLSAVSLGIDAVEMDLVISADKQVVVSHDPFMAAATVLTPSGKKIRRSREKDLIIYKMPYDSVKQYKVGLKGGYRKQAKMETYKPLLEEVLRVTEDYRKNRNSQPIKYYLEIKSRPQDYGVNQPQPGELAELIMETVKRCKMEEAVVIKSFDANFLNVLKQKYPSTQVSYLLYRKSWQEKLQFLEFEPDIISPYHKQLKKKEQVEELQAMGFKVIPWTVNSKRKIRKMINLGVDGIISDYPERVLKLNQKNPG